MKINNNKRKRIATIIWKDGTGGAERSLSDLAAALDRDEYDMRFYYLSGGPGHFAKQIQKLGFQTEFLQWENGFSISGRIRLILLLRQYRPHLIHDHILPLLTRPFVKLFTNCSILYTEHGLACKRTTSPKKERLRKLVERFDFLFCDLLAANSQASAIALQSIYNIPESKITVVHLGINLENFIPIKEQHSLFRIGYLGRILNTPKGVDRLPHLAKCLAEKNHLNFEILIAGDGPDRPATEKACITLGVEKHFKFIGWITDVQSFFSQIDVLVIPSRHEALGLIALEALAMEVPVVAFNTGGLPEILENCPNGFLVKQGDIEGMAKSIISAKYTPENTRSSGREYVRHFFSNHITAKNLQNIYIKMI